MWSEKAIELNSSTLQATGNYFFVFAKPNMDASVLNMPTSKEIFDKKLCDVS